MIPDRSKEDRDEDGVPMDRETAHPGPVTAMTTAATLASFGIDSRRSWAVFTRPLTSWTSWYASAASPYVKTSFNE